MRTYLRTRHPGGLYFFTAVTAGREPVFAEHANVVGLRNAICRVRQRRPIAIPALVVLPDHLHCIWRLPIGDHDYSVRWEWIKKGFSRWLHSREEVRQPRQVWQPRFWEHAIRDDDDLHRHLDYVHLNPVKHGLAATAAEWPYSTFGRYVARGWYPEDWGVRRVLACSGNE